MTDFTFSDKKIEGMLGALNFEKSSCPHCGSRNFVKYGRTGLGRQRYRCRECRKTFSETTGTPFMYSKKTLETWAGYLFCMEGRLALRNISKLLGMNLSTAFSWRHKILSVAETKTDTVLTETIEVNEFWLKENFKGCRRINPHFRDAEKRCQILMLSCRDSKGNILLKAVARKGLRKLEYAEISNILSPVIEHCKMLVTTSNLFYVSFAKKNKLRLCMPYSASYRRSGFSLKNAEIQARGFKGFLKRFRSVASKYLSHYMNWYRIMLNRNGSLPAEIMDMLSCGRRQLRVHELSKVQFDGTLRHD
ncbi:MAG: transposase, family [Firmicutes bacterium]|nr:transposase, family [Bacillota bacterium]